MSTELLTSQQRALLESVPLDGIIRIDVGLEGDWSGSVVTLWRRDSGRVGPSPMHRRHAGHRPSLELYFDGAWLGLHCFRREDGANIFDASLADAVISFVESTLGDRLRDPSAIESIAAESGSDDSRSR